MTDLESGSVSYQGHRDQWFGHITYSGCGEDIAVANIFKLIGIETPSYLDIGAHHPFRISNTALLYSRGSRGVNVEANPNLIGDFKIHRPDELTLNIGIGPKRGILPFYMFDAWSGRNTFDKNKAAPFTWQGQHFKSTPVDVCVITLEECVRDYCGGKFPDFMSMDIEGLDQAVLCSTDLTHGPKVICVETEYKSKSLELKAKLSRDGYFCYVRTGLDLIFVREEYRDELY